MDIWRVIRFKNGTHAFLIRLSGFHEEVGPVCGLFHEEVH